MSVDFRLFFAYHISMMTMFAAGAAGISVRTELLVTAVLAVVLAAFLQYFSGIGVLVTLASGAVLHFIVGVKLFDGTPTLAGYLGKGKTSL